MIDPKLLEKLNKDGWTQDGDVFRRGDHDSTIPVSKMASGRYNEDRLPTNRRRKKQRLQAARRAQANAA